MVTFNLRIFTQFHQQTKSKEVKCDSYVANMPLNCGSCSKYASKWRYFIAAINFKFYRAHFLTTKHSYERIEQVNAFKLIKCGKRYAPM